MIYGYILYLTANPIVAFGSTPGRVPMYFKISGHPIMAAMWIGCIPFYSNSSFQSIKETLGTYTHVLYNKLQKYVQLHSGS